MKIIRMWWDIYIYKINILFSLIILSTLIEVGRVVFFFFFKVQCSYFDFKHLEKQSSVLFHIHHKISTLVSKPIELTENILGEADHCSQQRELFN